jgi:hypothetical protein
MIGIRSMAPMTGAADDSEFLSLAETMFRRNGCYGNREARFCPAKSQM